MHRGRKAHGSRQCRAQAGKVAENEHFERSTMTEHPPMEISVRESGAIPILEVRGRLTIGDPSEQLHDALETVAKGGVNKVIVDLNGVPQIDSSGISALVRISIKLTREGGALRL